MSDSSPVAFSDSIEANLDIIKELLSGAPPGMRAEAKRAAATIEKAVVGIQRDNHSNPGAALGTAFAIYVIAQRLVDSSNEGESGRGGGLIQLLN